MIFNVIVYSILNFDKKICFYRITNVFRCYLFFKKVSLGESMPVPKRQHSRSRSGKRSAGKHKVLTQIGHCGTCSTNAIQHAVCESCGFYKGIKLLRTKTERAQERKIVKQLRERAKSDDLAYRNALAERLAAQETKTEPSEK